MLWFTLPVFCGDLSENGGVVSPPQGSVQKSRYFAEIRPQDKQALAGILEKAREISDDRITLPEPIVIVLHGPEGAVFRNRNYLANKAMVDLAAELEAEHIIDVKMCQEWLDDHGISANELPEFVDTVPSGPATVRLLQKEGYIQF